jgi:hypothetical protein
MEKPGELRIRLEVRIFLLLAWELALLARFRRSYSSERHYSISSIILCTQLNLRFRKYSGFKFVLRNCTATIANILLNTRNGLRINLCPRSCFVANVGNKPNDFPPPPDPRDLKSLVRSPVPFLGHLLDHRAPLIPATTHAYSASGLG